ncbi:hypothetical protein [Rubinisphaera margarita]|uniref:hypothetical protein n=1 Tax=Rubinisphaera margarita TaxID=2909586 RepID=UPI001EE7D121|nr:hypothetical protein [Rubinisphaera margarita]MCG6155260.1 hypothetical protein [Rubinisphaera margarita]
MKSVLAGFPFRVAALVVAVAAALGNCSAAHAEDDDGRLSAIGGLSAAHMYTTYIAIGATADAFGNDVYETEQVQDIMGGLVGMIDTLKKQLLLVQENCDDPSDQKYIDETIQVYNLLQEEARQLSTFAKSRDVSDHRAYEKARTTVWPRIEKLLGLDD